MLPAIQERIDRKNTSPIRVMQFGEGNFLRAFVDDFLHTLHKEQLFDGSVVVIQPLQEGLVAAMETQDYQYTLMLEGINQGKEVLEVKTIDVIRDGVNPYTDLSRFLDYARSESLEIIVSNTTEAGIIYQEEILSNRECPTSFPGKLLLLLWERYLWFHGDPTKGLHIIPCELIDENGKKLQTIVNRLALENQFHKDFIFWLNTDNSFHNTLVDRIVPGYPKDQAMQWESRLGYKDRFMVKGEIFHLWVIDQDGGLSSLLPFDKVGLNVLFVPDITPYRERKVSILNGAHSVMVPIGLLMGLQTVREAMSHPLLLSFLENYMKHEVLEAAKLPKQEMARFWDQVKERFMNPSIRHELKSIALNSYAKYQSRILPTLRTLKQQEKPVYFGLFAFASLFVLSMQMTSIFSQDDLNIVQPFLKDHATEDTKLSAFLESSVWNDEIFKEPNCASKIKEFVQNITQFGFESALRQCLEGYDESIHTITSRR